MAHFDYPPGTPTGTVPSLYVVPSTDWAFVIGQLYKAANFDEGGTWAPSAFITVGGSGFQFTGTGHSLAASARLNVESTGEIRLKNGSLLKVDGSLGDIRLEVLTNVATLTVQAGATVNIAGALNLNGTSLTTVESAAEIVWESGALATWESGSISTFEIGSTLYLQGDVDCSLTFVGSSFWTGSITNQAVITNQVKLIHSGSSARQVYRAASALSGSADADITVAYDRYTIPSVISANRQYTIRHTGTVPAAGERIKVSRMSQVTPSALRTAKIVREDATILFSFYAGNQGFAEFEFDGTDWQLIAGAQYASGTQSGYYDDVW